MKLVLDASVVVKALTEEADSEKAATLIAHAVEPIVPDLIELEVVSALAKKVRLAGLPSDQAVAALSALPLMLPNMVATPGLIQPAMALSASLDHALFDCIYLALAVERGATVVTSDRKFVAAATRAKFGATVMPLENALRLAIPDG